MLTSYGHAKIEWNGDTYCLSPTFVNMAKIGSPTEIIEDFKSFITTSSFAHKFNIALNVINSCSDKPLPEELTGRMQFSEWQQKSLYVKPKHGLPMAKDIITLAEHCFIHGICGKSDKKTTSGEPLKEFDAYAFMELARVHLGLSSIEASNMTMTEFSRMMDAKFPPEQSDHPTVDESNDMLAWFESQNKAH